MNSEQQKAAETLAVAVTHMIEAGPMKVARAVAMRMKTADGVTESNCIIIAESEEIAGMLEARLLTPTPTEIAGIHSRPSSEDWVPTLPQDCPVESDQGQQGLNSNYEHDGH